MNKRQRVDYIIKFLEELYPVTPVPLKHINNFELLVAVLLSAQCTDKKVNQVTPKLFKKAKIFWFNFCYELWTFFRWKKNKI